MPLEEEERSRAGKEVGRAGLLHEAPGGFVVRP